MAIWENLLAWTIIMLVTAGATYKLLNSRKRDRARDQAAQTDGPLAEQNAPRTASVGCGGRTVDYSLALATRQAMIAAGREYLALH